MVHAGCVFVAGIRPSRTCVSGPFEFLRWNACVHRLDLAVYSHPSLFLLLLLLCFVWVFCCCCCCCFSAVWDFLGWRGGVESEPMLTKGNPPYQRPRGATTLHHRTAMEVLKADWNKMIMCLSTHVVVRVWASLLCEYGQSC